MMIEECEHNWIAGNDPTYCNKCGETNTKVFIDTIASQAAELSALRERVKELEEELTDLISYFSRDDSTSTDWVCTLNDSERTAIKALLSTRREEE